MNTLTKANNHHGLPTMRDFFDVENLFEQGGFLSRFDRAMPAINVSENDKQYIVEVVSPGFKREDFKVSMNDDVLTISAETKSEMKDENKEYSRREYSYNSFTRSFTLPENAKGDNIDANYKNGVLELIIPKTETQGKTVKNIPIK